LRADSSRGGGRALAPPTSRTPVRLPSDEIPLRAGRALRQGWPVTDLERDLMGLVGPLIYPAPVVPLLLSVIAAYMSVRGARAYRRQEFPAALPRLPWVWYASLTVGLQLFVVLFAAAFSGVWALYILAWLILPFAVTIVAVGRVWLARDRHLSSLSPTTETWH
jgi:hypothetical protein